jgi:hypothetical protein
LYHSTRPSPKQGKRVFINLTPCVPLSFEGEGEEIKRGAKAPLKLLFLALKDVHAF